VAGRDNPSGGGSAGHRLLLTSSNSGKLREYRQIASDSGIELELLPDFSGLPLFEESAPTFAENSAGKALHYSQFTSEFVIADDSGLVVPALGGGPGVHSARYAGPGATDADRIRKLLREMEGKPDGERKARFVCVATLARSGRAFAVMSDSVEGVLLREPQGQGGFGYDPIFYFPELGRTFAEVSPAEKNRFSHRGKAFLKVFELFARLIQ
jgi:XTP/dITP diphosphohydrolase